MILFLFFFFLFSHLVMQFLHLAANGCSMIYSSEENKYCEIENLILSACPAPQPLQLRINEWHILSNSLCED